MQAGARHAQDLRTRALGVETATAAARSVAPSTPLGAPHIPPTTLMPTPASLGWRGGATAGLRSACDGRSAAAGGVTAAAGANALGLGGAGARAAAAAGGVAACRAAAGAQQRALSHWSALRAKLFPAARLALPLTAAAAVAAAGGYGHYLAFSGGAQLPSAAPVVMRGDAGLTHGTAAAGLTHGSPEAAAAADDPSAAADMRACRRAAEARGFGHPGMQPGAAWGSIGTARGGDGGGSGRRSRGGRGGGEMHAMFEVLLLFPA